MSADVLRWPAIGGFLRWRHARTTLQLVLLGLAAVVIAHGLIGPQTPTSNLAPVLTWVHYRGLLVIALLAAGNLFCSGCPFVLVRDVGRRVHSPLRSWPRVLRTKWIAIVLFVAVLFAYELFDLWALPRATAGLVLAYFVAALMVDLVFRGASFCKYLCPIGQFNFVASTLSPLELRIKEEGTCRTCRTVDCIKGRREPQNTLTTENTEITERSVISVPSVSSVVVQRGCELGLFLPLKVGNMDCTFCLDCVHACPHDNIALAARLPGTELADNRRRSGVGWWARRPDLAALALLFTFGGVLNAFAMVAPVYRVEAALTRWLGVSSEWPVLAIVFFVALVVLPLIAIGGAASLTGAIAGATTGPWQVATAYAYALIPFGVGMWTAHYLFHFLTGLLTAIPISQRAVSDLFGWPAIGQPLWRWVGFRPGAVFPVQLGFVLLGAMGSIAVAYRISDRDYPDHPGRATAPWALVTVAMAAVAIWILFQPMDMRGTGFLG